MGIELFDFVPWGSGMLGWSESAFQRRFGCSKLGVVSDPVIIIIIITRVELGLRKDVDAESNPEPVSFVFQLISLNTKRLFDP